MTKHFFKSTALIAALFLGLTGSGAAQFEDIRPEDRPKLDQQAVGVFTAVEPALERATASTVEVRVWRKRVGYGTVVAPEQVLAKWSDVQRAVRSLSCRESGGQLLPAKVVTVYAEDDLALLQVEGLKARPLEFAPAANLELGSFLALARPDGQAGGLGVVSVLPRSLRESDRAFLGVIMDTDFEGPGVRLERVEEGTGAAEARLRPADVVLAVNGKPTNGNFELSSALQKKEPGDTVTLTIQRGAAKSKVEVTLGGRPKLPAISRQRMDTMNRMGGHRYSPVVEDFARVIQTDMQIQPEDCGAPVVDLRGRVVGIALARAGRIKSFVLPAESVTMLLARKGEAPEEPGAVRDDGKTEFERREIGQPDPLENLERHMEDMDRILEDLKQRNE